MNAHQIREQCMKGGPHQMVGGRHPPPWRSAKRELTKGGHLARFTLINEQYTVISHIPKNNTTVPC